MVVDPRVLRTRQRVLGAAWSLLAQVGFERVTVDLVSERSGVARSTLYRHWATKDEILRDAFSALSMGEGTAVDRDGAGELIQYARAFAEGLENVWGRAAVTLAVSALDDPEQRVVHDTFVEGNRRDLAVLLARAVDREDLPPGTDVAEATERLIELVVSPLFYRYLFARDPADATDATRLASDAWRVLGGQP